MNEKSVENRKGIKRGKGVFYFFFFSCYSVVTAACKIWLCWVQGKEERKHGLLEKIAGGLAITVKALSLLAWLID